MPPSLNAHGGGSWGAQGEECQTIEIDQMFLR